MTTTFKCVKLNIKDMYFRVSLNIMKMILTKLLSNIHQYSTKCAKK